MRRPDLDAIRKRCEAATKGPWDWIESESQPSTIHVTMEADPRTTRRGLPIAICYDEDDQEANSAFIANARQDIPDLLAHIQELEANERR